MSESGSANFYRDELVAYHAMAVKRNYGQQYLRALLDLWRLCARRGEPQWESYRAALQVIDGQKAKVM